MAKPLLHHRQHFLVAAAFGVDHPVRSQAGAGKTGGEEIPAPQGPKHHASQPGGNAGGEQGRRGIVVQAGRSAGEFVQSRRGKTAARQPPIDCLQAESEAVMPPFPPSRFDRFHLGPQGGQAFGATG